MLKEELQKCKLCKLSCSKNNIEKGIPAGWGSGNKILVLGLSPSDSRNPTLNVMSPTSTSDTANIIQDCLKKLNFNEDDFYITNLVKCSFQDNVTQAECFEPCYNAWFIKELLQVSPRNIACLGEEVYNFISKKPLVTDVFNVFKVWHHAYISRDKSKFDEWMWQWKESIIL
jgi:uracil-DNA glycosylase